MNADFALKKRFRFGRRLGYDFVTDEWIHSYWVGPLRVEWRELSEGGRQIQEAKK